jgi:hypothetical protein
MRQLLIFVNCESVLRAILSLTGFMTKPKSISAIIQTCVRSSRSIARVGARSGEFSDELSARADVFSRHSLGADACVRRRRAAERAACYCCSKSLVIANEAVNYGRHVTARPGRAPTFQFIASLAQRLSLSLSHISTREFLSRRAMRQ